MSAQVELASQLLDFGFFRPPSLSQAGTPSLSQAGKLLEALYTNLDPKLSSRSSSSSRGPGPGDDEEDGERWFAGAATSQQHLRRDTLKLIIALSDLAANTRITHALHAFADIRRLRQAADDDDGGCLLVLIHSRLRQLEQHVFQLPILLTSNSTYTDAPAYVRGKHAQDDQTAQVLNCLLELSVAASNTKGQMAKDPERSALEEDLRNHAIRHLIKHITQRSSTIASLRSVQILVSAQAQQEIVKVLEEMHRLSTLRRKMFLDDEKEAYEEAKALISDLTKHISLESHALSDENIVLENQRIMLNEQVHSHILSLLLLPLDRKSRTDADARKPDEAENHERKEMFPDEAENHERKEMFQACYTFLKALACRFPAAQEQLFCYIERPMLSHIGILELDVSATIEEILRDNSMLISRVQSRIMKEIFQPINKHGRRSRWLMIIS